VATAVFCDVSLVEDAVHDLFTWDKARRIEG
jgi:hypothetical protein